MEKSKKLELLRAYATAVRQAHAIMSIDEDCKIDNMEFRQVERDIFNDPKVFSLVKNHVERR